MIPQLPRIFSEPFADPSQIPTWLVSRLTRQSVTVALSGDGGDELFGGYNRYRWGPALWRRIGRVPQPQRRAGGRALGVLGPATWERLYRMARPGLGPSGELRVPGESLGKLPMLLEAPHQPAFEDAILAGWSHPESVLSIPGLAPSFPTAPDGLSPAEGMMLRDLERYLPDTILTKVDRASMDVSLEVRVPILDHRVVALAWSLPLDYKMRDGEGKWILREMLARRLPRADFEGPKAGFAVPLATWLRGPLKEWAGDLLSPASLAASGLFAPTTVSRLWREHLSGSDRHRLLWPLLMVQGWWNRPTPTRGRPEDRLRPSAPR